MRRNRYSLLLALLFGWVGMFAQTSLEGKVTDAETGESIIFGDIALYKNGVLITGTQTDIDGNYAFSNIDPGTYDVESSYVGYQKQRKTGVVVLAGKTVRADFELGSGVLLDLGVVVTEYKVPLIQQDETTTGGVVTAEKIRNLPSKNINALAATTAGLSSIDGGAISIRGSRTDATYYYVDGIRVSGRTVPQSEIDQMQVITGGVEAQYGDVTGGIISITTKGPSAKFAGGLELETSEFLDSYGYNLLSGNLSGPILKSSEGRSILGFRVSGQYIDRQEDRPLAFGDYRASKEAIARIEADPLREVLGTEFSEAEFLTNQDVNLEKARPNNPSTTIDLTGKLDARLSDNIDITLSGVYFNSDDIFIPGQNFTGGGVWSLLNWQNNPTALNTSYRGNFRFRHRLGASPLALAEGDAEAKPSKIRNASYVVQFGYEKDNGESYDTRHGENFFNYGYVGDFDVIWEPAVGQPIPGGPFQHVGYSENFLSYTPGTLNPVLANYNLGLEDVSAVNEFNAFNSFLSGNYSSTWFGIHTNVGSIYNRYNKNEEDRYTFGFTGAFDFVPGSSNKGRHNIQFGLIYEQRIGRSWTVAPYGLWQLARQSANAHILGIDTMNVIGSVTDTIDGLPVTVDQYQTLIDPVAIADSDLLFFKRVRELTGQTLNEYVNVDGIDPNALSLDMFAPLELTDQQLIGYYGYDYLGNKLSGDVTFDDFFTDFDQDGRRKFTVAPNRPIYSAFYIQDKFTFKDIIFRLGLRVDRYDANTKVLKDPYSLYEIMDADDFFDGPGATEVRPPNVQDDWDVYVETEGSTTPVAYRDGEQWYFENGSPANDGNVIFGSEVVTPYYVEQDPARRNIKSRDFNPESSFEDYTPQVNWMPRLAFSFPISDEANFFAHYDILVQRPPSNTLATALDYYYFEDGPPQNNPNLKPEKTIDLELGFRQKISNSSAITISAYYKEMRDMIQARTYLYIPAPVNTYESFGNIDFGTVKGFSFSYDLRRTNNLEMTASYTLQFAEGTGSTANSQRGLTQRGNLRTLFPLNFDERHRFVANLDYRYSSGKAYNGPTLFGSDIFANAGVGFQLTTVSGRPYTKTQRPVAFGGTGFQGALNGARLPWNFTVDLRANKEFSLLGNAEEGRNPIYMNVYLRVENLFDTRNIVGVYSASGSAEDDGFLASPDGLSAINTVASTGGRDVDAFLLSYQWRLLNGGFYTLPRRIYLGVLFEF